ncbi:histidine ammonia-lyase [Porphyromonas crevioricanis JCM 15906]|uniref:Histidine ammonia-lyase n=2 Tax=Porphyromonas crevioricanis TaxID=393921 RepID=A0A2X4SST0_9PORP|nr:histidine ammonia-lyase [Porphyromonas crevioricanis]GAD05767.1 histidine ammonia-lyase [Porphyromonas crevioricanis JCM 15906]GAD06964.1 histidine ammonia-lyase [Porphyromonas crevioricanis JCM 13913]SJZ62720.1 histidine ammonia-lyase [Porphyromonas crevioricanis]SQH72871.1 Histidine ammonia-lyase [Porphyromonas crevioricanis]
MAKKIYEVGAQDLTLDFLEEFLHGDFELRLSDAAVKRIEHCRNYLDNKVKESDRPLYGITTGFGSLCNRSISADELTRLQENLVKSHSCSCGNEVNPDIVRLMLLLKAHALSIGNSGVQVVTVQRILDFLNAGALPVVYDRGSLGASGDLAPLANLFLPLIGEGEMNYKGSKRPSCEVLAELKLDTVTLKSKEGLALLNGTQFMSSHGVYALLKARRLMNIADYMGALSLDAFDGLVAPFDDRLHTIRPHKGQLTVARHMRELLEGSEQVAKPKKQVQDPYSFRCIPQVHGASRDAIDYVSSVVVTEINSVTDNPTVFPDDDMVVSGGNFHGQPLALVYDFLAIALAELGNISERRVAQLILGLRDLPEFLVANPGLNSGFMIPQYAAAAMVSQNKMYCHSAASDSIVSSNGQEDHVSMGANAATKLIPLIENIERIFGIELLNAAQAFEFRRPTRTSPKLEAMLAALRINVPRVEDDVVMYRQIQLATDFIRTYAF